ncbi:hypothetical protein Tco_1193032 [Tanacetum coccineum]
MEEALDEGMGNAIDERIREERSGARSGVYGGRNGRCGTEVGAWVLMEEGLDVGRTQRSKKTKWEGAVGVREWGVGDGWA